MNNIKTLVLNGAMMTLLFIISLICSGIPVMINLCTPIILLYSNITTFKNSIFLLTCFTLLNIFIKSSFIYLIPFIVADFFIILLFVLLVKHINPSKKQWQLIIFFYYLSLYYISMILFCILFNLSDSLIVLLKEVQKENINTKLSVFLNLSSISFIIILIIYFISIKVNNVISILNKNIFNNKRVKT